MVHAASGALLLASTLVAAVSCGVCICGGGGGCGIVVVLVLTIVVIVVVAAAAAAAAAAAELLCSRHIAPIQGRLLSSHPHTHTH